MLMSLFLFESEFLHIVAISFTALILNELIMVALEVTTWHTYMIVAEVATLLLYIVSMAFLPEYFGASWRSCVGGAKLTYGADLTFVLSARFAWKVAVMVAVSALPLWIFKIIKSRVAPAAYSKLL
jgi:phospholipid-translocating ATPase